MFDNGYVYLAASRLSVFSSVDDWAVVFEIFGFSPRTGIPDLQVAAFTSRPIHRETAADFVSEEAYRDFLRHNANFCQTFVCPIDDEDWIDPDDGERVSNVASTLLLRREATPLPSPDDYAAAGIILQSLPNLWSSSLAERWPIDGETPFLRPRPSAGPVCTPPRTSAFAGGLASSKCDRPRGAAKRDGNISTARICRRHGRSDPLSN